LLSSNGCYNATVGTDGNFVVYKVANGAVMWASNVVGLFNIYFT
jgi:hypothetical protein